MSDVEQTEEEKPRRGRPPKPVVTAEDLIKSIAGAVVKESDDRAHLFRRTGGCCVSHRSINRSRKRCSRSASASAPWRWRWRRWGVWRPLSR